MSAEIATAYVRIRPNMTGFQSGVESGVRSGFSNIAKIVGVAFGAAEAFRFGKNIVSGAEQVQKSLEVIKAEFGSAGASVSQFGEKGATALGISAQNADAASAKFGILFKNLGIGQAQAAKMTVGFEQLGGSLSAIRGADPTDVLNKLTLAAAGNTRGLKQLGIVVSDSQEKVAAFKLGLTSTITQGLTNGQKAIAIYALATQNLGGFMQQAANHANDAINVQRRLTAEWSNAKDALGAKLLPAVAAVATFLANNLPAAIHIASTAFHDFYSSASSVFGLFKPLIQPIVDEIGRLKAAFQNGVGLQTIRQDFESLSSTGKIVVGIIAAVAASFVVMAASAAPLTVLSLAVVGIGIAFKEAYDRSASFRKVIDDIKSAFKSGFSSGVGQLKKDFEGLSTPLKVAAIAIGIVTVALVAMAAASAPITATVVAIAALALGFEYAYTHSTKFKAIVDDIANFVTGKLIPAFISFGHKLTPIFQEIIAVAKPIFEDLVQIVTTVVGAVLAVWHQFGGTIIAVVKNDFSGAVRIIVDGIKIIRGIFDVIAGVLTGNWGKAWKGIKEIASGALDAVKTSITTWGKDIQLLFTGIWHAIEKVFLEGIKYILGLLASVPTKINTHIPGVGTVGFTNPAKKAQEELQRTIDGIGKKKNNVTAKVTVKTALDVPGIKDSAVPSAFAKSADSFGNKLAANVSGATQTGVTKGVVSGVQAGLDAGTKQSIANAQQSLTNLKTQLAASLAQEQTDILNAVNGAKQNLNSIGASLAQSIGAVLDQPLTVMQNKLTAAQNRLTLSNLRNSFLLPGGKELSKDPNKAIAELQAVANKANAITKPAIEAFILQYQQATLSVKQDQVNLEKTAATRRVANLTDLFNSGKISAGQLRGQLLDLLGKDGINYKKAGALLGVAFADGFREQFAGILKQAQALGLAPKLPGSGQAPTIQFPAVTIAKDQLDISKQHLAVAKAQTALNTRIAKATEKTAQEAAALNSTNVGPTSAGKNPGKQSQKTKALAGTG